MIGLAGIAWSDLLARAGAGTVPAITAVLRRGVGLRLIDDVPLDREAAWATLSSGVLAHQHGIVGADEAWTGGLRPTTRASWAYAPAWQRLAEAGLRTASVAWPFTAPGAAWPGAHVDDRLAQASGRTWQDWVLPVGVAPEAWRERLGEGRVHPTDVPAALLAPFVPASSTVDQRRDSRLVELAVAIARLSTNHAAAQALLGEGRWDVGFVFHDWLAGIQGRFAAAAAPFAGVVDAAWTLLDTMVAITLAAVPLRTTIMLVSLGWRGEAGFLAAAGPGIEPGPRADVAHGVDVVPTLLARHGLSDPLLGGRVLFDAPVTPLRPAPPAGDLRERVVPDAAMQARVEAFGHRPPAPPERWEANRLATLANLTMPHDAAAAARFAAAAVEQGGDEPLALGLLAAAAAAAGDAGALLPLAERIAAVAPGHVWEALIRGAHHALRGEAGEARPHLRRAEAEGGPVERIRAGAAWLMLDRPTDAARAFRLVTEAAPDRVDALIGLGMALAAYRPAEAEAPLRQALAADPASEAARAVLQDVLTRLGRTREAAAVVKGGAVYGARSAPAR